MEMPSSFLLGAILTILLIASAFIVGYKIMGGITTLQEHQRGKEIYEIIKEDVNFLYYQAEGSSKIEEINIEYPEILCFIDPEHPENTPIYTFLKDYDKKYLQEIIPNEIKNKSKKINFYYHKEGKFVIVEYIPHLVPKENFCIHTKTRLYLENKGYYVSIEPMVIYHTP